MMEEANDEWERRSGGRAPSSPVRWSRIPFHILEEGGEQQELEMVVSDGGDPKRRRRMWWDHDRGIFTSAFKETCIGDVPEPILATIFTCITDPRTRNSMALVCMEWYSLERATRRKLCLRGCVSDLYLIPKSFQAVVALDLSHCFPWGYSLFQTTPERALLIAQTLKLAFPRVKEMAVYVRDSRDIDMVAAFWPDLQALKLVRWHQRPINQPEEADGLGMEFQFLMQTCKSLRNVDLSDFYCWSEDIPHALQVEPSVSRNLESLSLMKISDGFKASELEAITSACMNLEELRLVLLFDPRLLDFVGNDALLSLGARCKKLRVLHLIDSEEFNRGRAGEPEDGPVDAEIGKHGLIGMFQALPLLEDLAIMLSQNVRDAALILEALGTHCKRLMSLSLSHFQGLCKGPQPDGLAMCSGLTELVIKNCADLDDIGLSAIATGNTKLRKLELHCCRGITKDGLHIVTHRLWRTLVDVRVSCCFQLSSIDTLWALQPIQGTIEELHIDCIVDRDFIARQAEIKAMEKHRGPCSSSSDKFQKNSTRCPSPTSCPLSVDVPNSTNGNSASITADKLDVGLIKNKFDSNSPESTVGDDVIDDIRTPHSAVEIETISKCPCLNPVISDFSLSFCEREWSRLNCLSLWIPIGELLSPLPEMGLSMCPSLTEIRIKVEGDCRTCPKPNAKLSGLGTFITYPALSKLILDCSEIVGYALSAPAGHMELSLWERWYMLGIQQLPLWELDYWPPQDRDANRRGISLPCAGLISQCLTLRKLTIHGTINEHMLRMFLKTPNLRDVQLRIDYYPAPEVELNTEMRADACRRFEAALSARGFPD